MDGKDPMAGEDRDVRELVDALSDEPMPDLAPAVMARIATLSVAEEEESGPGRRAGLGEVLGWLWRPRSITIPLRPSLAAAVAAIGLWLALPMGPDRAAPPAEPSSVFVQFRLDVADARDVRLAGDFTNWQPTHELREVAPGTWTVVVPMRPGVHEYAFVVDGERWTPDPLAEQVADGFGGLNSRVAILVPERTEAI
jgi:hypothetical protein